MNPLVSVIVLNWNGIGIIEECLESLKSLTYSPIEIIVVDNGSTDGSVPFLRKSTQIRLIENKENLGYAAGNNVGFRIAQGKYIATLNNDMTVAPSWIENAVKYLENDSKIGIISCRQMNYFEKEKVDGLYAILKPDLTFFPFGYGRQYKKDPLFDDPSTVLCANGGSAIYRKELLDHVGDFEETYFGYYEEIDLGLKSFLQNWNCVYAPDAIVYHKSSLSFKKKSDLFYYLRERNRLICIYKYIPTKFFISLIFNVLLYEAKVIYVISIKIRKPSIYFKSRIDALREIIKLKQIRRTNLSLLRTKLLEEFLIKQKIPYMVTNR